MNTTALKAIAQLKLKNQSDIARAAGVTRQRVSQWFKEASPSGFVNIETKHLRSLCESFRIDVKDLLVALPGTTEVAAWQREETKLNWDKLYPDVISLLVAAVQGSPDAVARVVQEYGLFEASKLFGKSIWTHFPTYKRLMKPNRRKDLELIWHYMQNQTMT
jgi:hypothetical protein